MNIANLKNIHQGERCFIMGSGPSIAAQDLTKLRYEITMCSNWFVNHKDFDSLNINYYCAYDNAFVSPEINTQWYSIVKNMAATKFFPSAWSGVDFGKNTYYLPYDSATKVYASKRFSCDLEHVVYDAGSVIINFCLPVAIYMGCKQILLLGVETNYGVANTGDPNRGYFYDATKQLTPNMHTLESENQWVQNMLQSYLVVADYALRNNIRIINCTPSGNLDVFERRSLEDVLEKEMA